MLLERRIPCLNTEKGEEEEVTSLKLKKKNLRIMLIDILRARMGITRL